MDKEHPVPEILPLKKKESVIITNHQAIYSPQLHYHPEYEIVFIYSGSFKRTIGSGEQQASGPELLLLGPGLYHKIELPQPNDKAEGLVSVHLNSKFLNELNKKERQKLNAILEKSAQGILFPTDTALLLKDRMTDLINLKKKAAFAELTEILSIMAEAKDYSLLNKEIENKVKAPDTAMAELTAYLKENYRKRLTLGEICHYTNKSNTSFNRFIKKHTGITFTNYLNYIRTGFAARKLIETTDNVADVAASSGFNNLAHFNRIFKNIYGIPPLRYRQAFYGRKKYL